MLPISSLVYFNPLYTLFSLCIEYDSVTSSCLPTNYVYSQQNMCVSCWPLVCLILNLISFFWMPSCTLPDENRTRVHETCPYITIAYKCQGEVVYFEIDLLSGVTDNWILGNVVKLPFLIVVVCNWNPDLTY